MKMKRTIEKDRKQEKGLLYKEITATERYIENNSCTA